MTAVIPPEADWEQAPGLLTGAKTLELSAERCNLGYWLSAVAQGTLRDRAVTGHHNAAVPPFMKQDGPLREAMMLELGLRSVAEEKATRILSYYVANAPGIVEMEFYATQLIDEARHSKVFRDHLVELGVPAAELHDTIAEMSREYVPEVLQPVEDLAARIIRDERDFVGGVAVFTIVIEGVLAPAAELAERKWDRLDPAASEISRGAAIDEIRHLTVGSSIIRDHLIRHPEYRPRLMEILAAGRELWDRVPDRKYVMYREELFQKGMAQQADLLRDYEVWPGRLLLDTTPEERYDMAERWTDEMAESRLRFMGLEDALPLLSGTDVA
ncbi:VlmB-like protein [Actinoplanes teichomyceticus]|uniref:VlmB-like protein n=1 Tax=Actinoplanes teichomyceticus TaxID=1867 RepID=A0A561WLP7_ACTTI|nr:VlmB-like protein [Actinoplanes teichomyceticus]TWG24789.1 hypothetical protein FHX34_1021352 [Actinoplanes teichomyceticus]GIF14549.1 hypothetical protein Ate01nite_45810 [Actinoplanes teichomyceticus]